MENERFSYVSEICERALVQLLIGSGPEWRERIKNAAIVTRPPGLTESLQQGMSPGTLAAWEACVPEKPFDSLTDHEVREAALALKEFILGWPRDDALREARQNS